MRHTSLALFVAALSALPGRPCSSPQPPRTSLALWGGGGGARGGDRTGGLLLRLRGGAQGTYMDRVIKEGKRGRAALRKDSPAQGIVEGMMDLERFPESLETPPIKWHTEVSDNTGMTHTSHLFNEQRIVYDPVGGDEKAYRGIGLAGMAVHTPRQWPYAIPEVIGHRSWKNYTLDGVRLHARPQAAAMRVSTSTSWRFKMELKERKKALRGVLAKLRTKAIEAKTEERLRLQRGREMKLRGRLRTEQYQVISNPKKIAKLSRKQKLKLKRAPELPLTKNLNPLGLTGREPPKAALRQ